MKFILQTQLAVLITLCNLSANAQKVGIGTIGPIYTLDIHSLGNAQLGLREGTGGQTALFSRYTNRLEIQPSDALQISVGGIDQRNLCIANNGYIGIKNSSPLNQLEIGAAPGFSGNNLAMGNGTQGMSFYQSSAISNWFSNTGFALMPNGGKGYVGLGVQNPANKLQIGSMGSSNYNGNDIAFGNGTQVSGISQTASVAQWYSNTNIALMPMGNGHGRVGINTTNPGYPLDVEDYIQLNEGVSYFKTDFSGSNLKPATGYCLPCTPNVSIYAQSNVFGLEFDAYSDARIKDIKDISNSESDLTTLNKLQITDYTLKDKIKSGNKLFKKVIAQQVEEVYPEIVNKSVNYIPNVYQLSSKVEKTNDGCLVSFKTAHNLSKDAKKLQLIEKSGTQQRYDIIAIPSGKEVLINAPDLKDDTVFVYGEQVNDFRTVDYDGLTTLNISATQQLSKLVKQQQAEINAQDVKIAELMELIKKLNNKATL